MSAHSNHRHIRRKLELALVGIIAAAALPLAARASTIGLYSDESGSSCSFSGNAAGQFTAYVVVKPDDRGLHGVRFSAPIPSCLGATFVEDLKPLGGETIGESPSGISVAWGTCQTEPALALTIHYYRNTSTDPCCAFPIAEDSFVHMIEGVDCSYVSYELEPIVSHFNADASCACNDAAPPSPPRVALPANGSTTTIVSSKLQWTTWSQDTDITSFDLYFGTGADPAFKTTLTAHSYTPTLQPLTQYYWRVVAHDSEGFATSSPTWTFTTRPLNSAPSVVPVAPSDGATDVARAAPLWWSSYDIDGDALHYDIYLGTESDPPLLVTGETDTTLTTAALAFSTVYHWKVVAHDTHGHEAVGPVWSFTTRPDNYAPFAASLPTPASNSNMQPISLTLRWAAGDPDPADVLSFDVYFGTSSTPPLVESDVSSQSLARSGLHYDTKYYWRVVTRDNHGAEKFGPVWFFTTRPANLPPTMPSSPTPPNNTGGIATSGRLQWTCSDPEGQAVSYDVYLGLEMQPSHLVGHTTNPYLDYSLQFLGRYYWQVVAKDASGNETEGPIWSFVSALTPGANMPPLIPSHPSPAKASTNQALDLRLTWTCSDPNNNALYYDVYLGTDETPALVASNVNTKYYEPSTLVAGTTYYWQIVARDSHGAETSSPLWSFGTLMVANFSAVPLEQGVEVTWRLAGTEGMESYTLLRTELRGEETVLAQGAVTQVSGSFLDASAERGSVYHYSLSVHSVSGDDIRSSTFLVRAAALELAIHPNHPNPFNPETTIPYDVAVPGHVQVAIYDAAGRRVRTLVNEDKPDGAYQVIWNGTNDAGNPVSSGVYFCVLQTHEEHRTRKLVLLK